MVKLPSDEKLVIAAIGEAGEGKSTLLNLILNTPGEDEIFFDVSDEPEACTITPTVREGIWRGDPGRPVVVIDTPGLGADDDPECDTKIAREIVKILNKFGHINAFVIVLKSGQSRFLSQHQHMFSTFQDVFGTKFWKNSIIDVSHSCDARSRKKVEAWLEKLSAKFPAAADALNSKVFIDAPEMENETLEEFYFLCKSKEEFSCLEFQSVKEEMEKIGKHQINSSLEDISHSSECMSGSEDRLRDTNDFDHSRPQSRTAFNNSYDCSRPSSSMFLEVPRTMSRSDMNLHRPVSRSDLSLNLPPLPPRSPTFLDTRSRRRTLPSPTYTSCRSLTSTPRLPRAFLPSFSPTDEFSSLSSSMSPSLSRLSRRSESRKSLRDLSPMGLSNRTFSRETSPISYSCRNSRESSPSPTNKPSYPTIGLPTYVRTSYAFGFPFKKAMRSGRLVTKMAIENEVELEPCPAIIPSLPDRQIARVSKSSLDQDLVKTASEQIQFERFRQTPEYKQIDPELHEASVSIQQHCYESVPNENVVTFSFDECQEFVPTQTEKFKARKISEPKIELELFKPESMLAKNPFTLIKKALLPKIKYHWDQGFAQGKNGWQKCPIIKMKIKYNEEDHDLLPPSVSVEGGRHCESRRVKLDGGKAKLKLKTNEVVDVQLRVVPLDKNGRQEAWVPEFLFTVQKEAVEERKEGEKWWKAVVTPAMPE